MMKQNNDGLNWTSLLVLVAGLASSPLGCADNGNDDPGSSEATATLAECPQFADSYLSCEKTAGAMPQFFETVSIETMADGYLFNTPTEQGPFETRYIPDNVVRLGSDTHIQEDGTPLFDLPSLESSHCEGEQLFRNEVTILPDQSIAQETITMDIGDDGRLNFRLIVNGDLLLEASCSQQ